jgi:hypothetical protein
MHLYTAFIFAILPWGTVIVSDYITDFTMFMTARNENLVVFQPRFRYNST